MAPCIALRSSASCHPSTQASFLPTKKALPPPSLPLGTPPRHPSIVMHSLSTPGLDPAIHFLGHQSSKFADSLGAISSLFIELGEERRAADEYMQRTAEERGRSTKDYERRARLFERSGEMVAASKLKRERLIMELELLHGEVWESDEGRAAADYLRRAQIFSKSAEIFSRQGSDEAIL